MKKVIVVGGGISGLATAYLLQKKARAAKVDLEVTLLEQERRVGGKIWSIKEEGYLCEWGPNGFLDSKPQTLDLCRDLGAAAHLLRSNDNARKRFIYADGMLHQLPENGPAFLKSKLISWPGKLRLALEPFAGKPPLEVDETLAEFARRRLGDEALRKLIGPMVGKKEEEGDRRRKSGCQCRRTGRHPHLVSRRHSDLDRYSGGKARQ